tara:strand:- start:685 stop:894 length:210 start_codon:yes stop_codon:yes gene_type:complete
LLVVVVLVVVVFLVMAHQVVVALVVSVITILNHSPHLLALIQLLLVRVELVLNQEIVLTTPVEMEAIVY